MLLFWAIDVGKEMEKRDLELEQAKRLQSEAEWLAYVKFEQEVYRRILYEKLEEAREREFYRNV